MKPRVTKTAKGFTPRLAAEFARRAEGKLAAREARRLAGRLCLILEEAEARAIERLAAAKRDATDRLAVARREADEIFAAARAEAEAMLAALPDFDALAELYPRGGARVSALAVIREVADAGGWSLAEITGPCHTAPSRAARDRALEALAAAGFSAEVIAPLFSGVSEARVAKLRADLRKTAGER